MAGRILYGLAKIYIKPSTGQVILRKPTSEQRSEALARAKANFAKKAAGNKIATACRGRKGRDFWSCLRVEGKKHFGTL